MTQSVQSEQLALNAIQRHHAEPRPGNVSSEEKGGVCVRESAILAVTHTHAHTNTHSPTHTHTAAARTVDARAAAALTMSTSVLTMGRAAWAYKMI